MYSQKVPRPRIVGLFVPFAFGKAGNWGAAIFLLLSEHLSKWWLINPESLLVLMLRLIDGISHSRSGMAEPEVSCPSVPYRPVI